MTDRRRGAAGVFGLRGIEIRELCMCPRKAYSRLGVIYRDADEQVTRRVITVGALISDDDRPARVVAYCHLRGASRRFWSDRFLGFFDPDTGAEMRTVAFAADLAEFRRLIFSPRPPEKDAPFSSIAEAHALYAATLAGSGWVVRARSAPWAEYLELHRRFRRGEGVLKAPSVSLGYAPIFEDQINTPNGYQTVPGRSRDRPWIVAVLANAATSFASAAEAAAAFEVAANDDEVKWA